MVKVLCINYSDSASVVAQGKQVSQYEKKGYYKKQGGNGTYIMVKPSTVDLLYEVNGRKRTSEIKELIRQTYNLRNVGEKQADRFYSDIKSGKVNLEYSPEKGLYTV